MSDKDLPSRVADQIITNIRKKSLAPGEKLPPLRDLSEKYGVAYATMHKALGILRERNMVDTRPGSGTFVLPELAGKQEADNSSANPASKRIGVLVPSWANRGGGTSAYETVDGFLEVCTRHSWDMELITPGGEELNSPALEERVLAKNLDGFVWLTPMPFHNWLLMELSHKLDCVVASERPFESMGINTVHPDYYDLARQIVELFMKRGHHDILLFTSCFFGVWADPYTMMFIEAVRNEALKAGLRFGEDCYSQVYPMPDREASAIIKSVLSNHPEKNAIICLHNLRLPRIISELRSHHPNLGNDDVTIVDNCYKSNVFYTDHVEGIGIYRVKYPNREIGREIARIFENKWLSEKSEARELHTGIIHPGEELAELQTQLNGEREKLGLMVK